MFDDIVKALTIQVKADDLTGGAWSAIGNGVKSVWNNVTAMNQAWELTTRVMGQVENIAGKIGKGGDLAEATAGLRGLAETMGRQNDGKGLLQILDSFAEGELNIIALTNEVSNSLRRGFSDSQLTTIYAFARKFADTTGASFVDTVNTIEKALSTGVYKPLKDILGEAIENGATAEDILAKLARKTEEFGESAFNLSDSFRVITGTIGDFSIETMRAINDMIGESGFDGLAQSIRSTFWEIRDDIPWVLNTIWESVSDLTVIVKDFFSMFFDETDTAKDMVYTVTKTIGGTIYDLKWLAVASIEAVASPFVALMEKVVKLEMYLQDLTGTSSETARKMNSDFLNDLEAMKTLTKTVEDDKKAWEERTDAAYESSQKTEYNVTAAWNAAGKALKDYGIGFINSIDFLWKWADGEEEVEKKTKKTTEATKQKTTATNNAAQASKTLSDETKELAKTYDSLGKSFEGTIKTMGDVVNKTQEGINSTAGGLVDYIKTADMFTFGSSQKKSQIEAVMEDLQQQKGEEMRVLEKSADAQIELAKAYTQFANTPRKIEHSTSGSAKEILMSLVNSIIETLNNLSLTENTPVAGVA